MSVYVAPSKLVYRFGCEPDDGKFSLLITTALNRKLIIKFNADYKNMIKLRSL